MQSHPTACNIQSKAAGQVLGLLAQRDGIFGGYSAGANLAGAVQLLQSTERGGTIAIVICDSGLKYLSTNLWGMP